MKDPDENSRQVEPQTLYKKTQQVEPQTLYKKTGFSASLIARGRRHRNTSVPVNHPLGHCGGFQ